MGLLQLRASRTEHQQRHPLRPVGQVLEEGEQRVVCPVQVLEHEHGRALCGQPLQETPPGRERLVLRGGLRGCTHERGQAGHEPDPVGIVGRDGTLELGLGLVGRVRLEDAALGLDDLPERPEGDPLPVGEAAPLAPGDELGPLVDVAKELRAQAALAHPGLADDRHQLTGTLLQRTLERPDQKRLLQLPAHERRGVRTGHV